MLNKLKSTFKHTIIYSIGNLSLKLIGIVLLPLYTTHLESSEYGAYAILEVTSMILVSVLSFRLSTAMMRWWAGTKDYYNRKSIVFTSFISAFIIVLIFNLLVFPFYNDFSILFFGSENYNEYFLILFLSVSFEILNFFPMELLRIKEKSALFIFITISKTLTVLFLNILLIAHYKLGIKGILIGQMTGNILVFVITFPFLRKNMVNKYNFEELRGMFKYGFPLIFTTMAMMLMNLGDRYILKYLLGYSEVGIYTIGYKIGGVINVFILQSFKMGFLPIAYKQYSDDNQANRFFTKVLTYFVFILVIAGLSLSLFSKEIVMFFSKREEYWSANQIVPLLSLAFVLQGIQYVFSLGLHYVKKTKYNAFIVLSIAVLNIGLNFLLIPRYKIIGAAVTTVISWILMTILFYYFSQREYYIGYEILKIVKLISLGIILFIISTFFSDINIIFRILLKVIIIVAFPWILYLTGFYEKIEIERITQAWLKWRNPIKWRQNMLKMKMFSKK
jgi:O-antigen/teichoic acid export membrane protein